MANKLSAPSLPATWPRGTACRLQILHDRFDSWLEPIAFDIMYRVVADSKSTSSFRSLPQLLLNFQFNKTFTATSLIPLKLNPFFLTFIA